MMEPIATRLLTYVEGSALVEHLVKAGLDPDLFARIVESRDNALAGKMVSVAQVGYESPDERLARRVMGENFFGREEWGDLYKASLTSKLSRVAAKFPWNDEVFDSECPFNPGKTVRETHFAFLGMDELGGQPLTIMQWQHVHPAGGQPCFYNYGQNCWYPNEEFAIDPTCEFRWYLALKEIVPGSPSISWNAMQDMIPKEYYVPSPVMELTKGFMVYQKTKKYPNENHYAATDTLDSGGYRVVVGDCDDETVFVGRWDGDANGSVGLGLFRK